MNNNVKYQRYNVFYICMVILLLSATWAFSGCGENEVGYDASLPALTLKMSSPVSSYSSDAQSLEFVYHVVNSGNTNVDGPVTVISSLMTVYCPELKETGNNDALLQPDESIVCNSNYTVTSSDLNAKNIVNTATAIAGGIISNQDSVALVNQKPESLLIFPFDTTDPSVIFRSSLTSSISILHAGGTEESGSLNEFDSVLGMKLGMVENGVPGCRFTASSVSELASLKSGQLSIEVEREWLAITDPNTGSTGYNRNVIEYLLSFGSSDVNATGRIMMQPDSYLIYQFSPSDATRSDHYVNTKQSDQFARLTISWMPGETRLYIDGLLLARINRTDDSSDHLANIFIGSLGGSKESSMQGNYYIRNLIVSSLPVITNNKSLLRHVMHIGDSFAAGQPLHNNAPNYDGTIVNTVIRELFTNGFSYEKYTVHSNGGGKIQDLSNDPLELEVTNGGGVTRAEALSEDPSLIVFITGGNDLGIFQSDLFSMDLHDHVEAFLGVNGHLATNVQHVIVTTTTSSSSASSDNLLAMRDIMLDLPNWWNATYPDMSGRVHVVDTWVLFGGSIVDLKLFGLSDPVHPSAGGNIIYGQAIAEKIMELVH